MKRLILFIFLCGLSYGQKIDVRGVVTDSSNGEKIPYATVEVKGIKRGAATNTNGFYLIAGILPGEYIVSATSLGFLPQIKNIIIRGSEPITVNFRLISKPIEVMEVEILGGQKSEIAEISTSTHVLSQKDLLNIPVVGQGDLFRSIQVLPGIVTTADVSSKFFVRGGAGDQNLIIYDGLKIYNPFHAFGIFSIFDPDIIKSTEIYTGGFPPGYGGRLSSVINVQSDDGNATRLAGKVAANLISGKILLEGPLPGNNSWLINARRSLVNNSLDKFLSDSPPISFYDLFAKAKFGGGDYGKYSLNVFSSKDAIDASNSTDPAYVWKSTASSLKISDLLQDRAYFETVISFSDFSIERNVSAGSSVYPANSSITDMSLRTDITLYTESQDLYFLGFEVSGLSNSLKYSTGPTKAITLDNTAAEFWGWFRFQTHFGKIAADAGIHSDIIGLVSGLHLTTILQPRMNASYSFDNGWKLKTSVGVFTQRLMTLTNEDDIVSLFEAWIFIPKEEEPQKAVHYVVGVEGNIFAELSASLQYYYKDYTSLTLYNRDKKFSSEPDYLQGKGRSFGIETMLRYKFDVLDLYLAYTWGKTTVSVGPYSYPPRYDRRHNLNMLGITRIAENFDCSLKWEFGTGYAYSQTSSVYYRLSHADLGREPLYADNGSPYFSIGEKNTARLPAYHRLDMTITYHFMYYGNVGECGITIINLYNNKNILYYDRKTSQTIYMLPLLPTLNISLEF